MLTPDYLEHVADDVIDLYAEFEQTIIRDIAKRLLKTNLLVPSVNHQIKVLQESGLLYNDIIKEISKITGKSETKIKKIFEDSAMQSISLDDSIYKEAGLNPLPFNQSKSILQMLIGSLEKTNKQVNNLTMTLAGNAQAKFTNAVNLAYMQITTGAFDKNTAILNAVKVLSDDGLDIVYPSGKVSKVDVAVRRAVLTGVSQTCGKLQEIRAEEMNCDLMELTAHPGARVTEKNDYTNHSWWQGKIVSRSGKKGYLSLEDIGYGEVTGFLGINCRHGWFPFYEGITKRTYTDEELANINNQTVKYKNEDIELYEATKKQREKERNIRRLKREVGAYEEILKNTDNEELKNVTNIKYINTKNKLKNAQNDLKDFIEETELRRDYTRERVYNNIKKNSFKEDNKIKSAEKNDNIVEYGSSKYLNEDIEKVCNEVYNKYEKNGYENITLVDTKTNSMIGGIHTDYKKDSVDLSSLQKELSRKCDDRSLILVHNHPNNSTFSLSDISGLLKSKKLKGIIAVGEKYNYFLEIIESNFEESKSKEIMDLICNKIVKINNTKKVEMLDIEKIYKEIFNGDEFSYGKKKK